MKRVFRVNAPFLDGLFSRGISRGKNGPLRRSGRWPIKVGKRRIEERKRPGLFSGTRHDGKRPSKKAHEKVYDFCLARNCWHLSGRFFMIFDVVPFRQPLSQSAGSFKKGPIFCNCNGSFIRPTLRAATPIACHDSWLLWEFHLVLPDCNIQNFWA